PPIAISGTRRCAGVHTASAAEARSMFTEQSAPSTMSSATPNETPSTVPGTPPPAIAKSPLPGWLLWFFICGLGAHRFYFGKMGSGLGMAGLWLMSLVTAPFGIGFVGFLGLAAWWVYDAFQINKWARGEESAMSSSTSRDRKSTCLNSSHVKISYAVFCLKKKTRSIYIRHAIQ